MINRFFNQGYYFGDYNVFSDHPSEYQFQANSTLKTLALPKYKFIKVLENYPEIRHKMISASFKYSREMAKAMVGIQP